MFGFVKSPRAGAQFLLLFTAALLLIPPLWHQQLPDPHIHNGEGWLYFFWRGMLEWPPFLQIILNVPVIFLAILLANQIDHKHQITEVRSPVVSWILLFLLLTPGVLTRFHPAFLASILLTGSQAMGLALYRSRSPAFQIFNLSFLFSTAVMVYPPVLWMLPVFLLTIALMSSPAPNQWTAALLGLAGPPIMLICVALLISEGDYLFQNFFRWFEFRKEWRDLLFPESKWFWVWLTGILFWILLASLRFRSQKNLSRQFYLILFFQFLAGLLTMVFMQTVGSEMIWILAVPAAFLFANWIQFARSGWFRDLFFLFLVGYWVWINLLPVLNLVPRLL